MDFAMESAEARAEGKFSAAQNFGRIMQTLCTKLAAGNNRKGNSLFLRSATLGVW